MKGKGVYRYTCPRHNIDYVGETMRSFEKRDKEHNAAAAKGNWSHSGRTQHKQHCDAPIGQPEILSRYNEKKKTKEQTKFDLRIQEALFIKRFDCGPNHGMNEDWGSYVKTSAWAPVFNRM